MNCKGLHPDDYKDLGYGIRQAHHAYAWCLGHGIPIAWPHEHRLWEYAGAFQAIHDHPIPIQSVLDIGAGNSILGPSLALKGLKVVEVDPSPNVYTSRRNERAKGVFEARAEDFLTATLEPVDAVMSISVMEHIPADRQEEAWRKAAKLVKPGGLLYVTVDYTDDKGKDLLNADGRENPFDQQDIAQVIRWLNEEGFSLQADLNYQGNHVFNYTFYRVCARKGKL